jgi:hypothetical protein
MSFLGSILKPIGSIAGGLIGGAPGAAIGSALGGALGGSSGNNSQSVMSGINQAATGGSNYNNSSVSNQGSTTYGTGVWGAQSPYLQDLFSRAQGMSQGGGYMPNYGQAQGALDASQQGLMQMAGDQSMDPRMGAYANQLGRQFNQQILPGLRGNDQMAGGLGSSRAGIGQGLAAAQFGQQLQDFGAQLYGGQQDRRLQAQMGLQGLAGQQASLQGMQQAAPWYAMNQYRSLLGAPVQNNLGGTSFGNTTSAGRGWSDQGLLGAGGGGGGNAADLLGQLGKAGSGWLGNLFGGGGGGSSFGSANNPNYYDVGNYS